MIARCMHFQMVRGRKPRIDGERVLMMFVECEFDKDIRNSIKKQGNTKLLEKERKL